MFVVTLKYLKDVCVNPERSQQRGGDPMTASTTASASPTPSVGSGVSQETLASKPGLEAPPKGETKMIQTKVTQ